MRTIIKTSNDEFTDSVRVVIDEKFGSLERVLSKKINEALLSIDVNLENKHSSGDVFSASGHLVVGGAEYNAVATNKTIDGALESIRNELVRGVRKNKSRTMSAVRKGGAAIKSLLMFGRK